MDTRFKIRKKFAIISGIILFLILAGGFAFKPLLDYKYAIDMPCLYGKKDCTHEGKYEWQYKCPNDYATAEEYAKAAVLWLRTEMDKNPQADEEELLEKRVTELKAHECEPSKWLLGN